MKDLARIRPFRIPIGIIVALIIAFIFIAIVPMSQSRALITRESTLLTQSVPVPEPETILSMTPSAKTYHAVVKSEWSDKENQSSKWEIADVLFRAPGDWRYEIIESSKPEDVGKVSVVVGSETGILVENPDVRREYRAKGVTVIASRKAFEFETSKPGQGGGRLLIDSEFNVPLKYELFDSNGLTSTQYQVLQIQFNIPIVPTLFEGGIQAGEG